MTQETCIIAFGYPRWYI